MMLMGSAVWVSLPALRTTAQPPFFENLVASGAVEKDEFSFYLGRLASGTGNDSELTLGGRDSTRHTGPFITVPVISKKHWLVALENVTVNGLVGGLDTSGVALIDTGTVLITASSTTAEGIISQIPGGLTIPRLRLGQPSHT